MSSSPEAFFRGHFSHLSDGLMPYPWQQKLFSDLISDQWPDSIPLPTGAGKTAIIKIWLIALGWTLQTQRNTNIPRRLAWVVNRRVVVDQATSEVEAIAEKLRSSDTELARALRACCVSDRKMPLAVSTLRGQMADNREWSYDPLTPAVIIGTVDMIGSRLLFRGYRDGKYSRPQHAGLLGVDTLIANDESHLTPAFVALLSQIAKMKPAAETGKPFRVLFVSATQASSAAQPFIHDLDEDISQSASFHRVYEAEKRLVIEQPADNASLLGRMRDIALASDAKRTLIFVESPDKAAELAAQLQRSIGDDRVALLTGTMRGWERDQLAESKVFKTFAEPRSPEERYFLVTTSAGEVGVNISGELLITQLQESDHLAQRFGRLNRFGDQDDEPHRVGQAHVIPSVKEKDEDRKTRFQATLRYLGERLPRHSDGTIDISCRALYEAPAPAESRSKQPKLALLDQRLIQNWSQTTFPNNCVPDVDSYLHGKDDGDYPETELAWRAELDYLVHPQVSDQDRKKALDTYRILPHEIVRQRSDRLLEKLERLSTDDRRRKVLIQWRSRDVEVTTAEDLIAERERNLGQFRDALIVLPPGCGKLSHGIFHPTDGEAPHDVADLKRSPGETRERWLAEKRTTEEDWNVKKLASSEEPARFPDWADAIKSGRIWKLQIKEADEANDAPEQLLLLVTRVDSEKKKSRVVLLDDHLRDVKQQARSLANQAAPDLITAYETAGQHHDEGKKYELWQTAMGNKNGGPPIAKSNRPARPRLLEGYRHELASLLDCKQNIHDDLTLHLIASHHGWARPYWEARAYGPDHSLKDEGQTVLEAVRRFSRLQQTYGPWGLAYLEALFKAADGIASSEAEGENGGE
jgi:CRISPR-associated endonuclease/helicase Cas3